MLSGPVPDAVIILLEVGDVCVTALRNPVLRLTFGKTVRPFRWRDAVIRVRGSSNSRIMTLARSCIGWCGRRVPGSCGLLSDGNSSEKARRRGKWNNFHFLPPVG